MSPLQTAAGPIRTPRRAAPRLRLHLPATVTLLRGKSRCLIENISASGAQLLMPRPPALGDAGELECEHVSAFFTTLWSVGNLVGVEFDEPIPPRDIIELRRINDNYSEFQRQDIRRNARRWVSGELD